MSAPLRPAVEAALGGMRNRQRAHVRGEAEVYAGAADGPVEFVDRSWHSWAVALCLDQCEGRFVRRHAMLGFDEACTETSSRSPSWNRE